MKQILAYLEGDKVIWIVSIFLALFSVVSVYSFIPILIKANGGSTEFYLIKHTLLVLTGFGLMYFVHRLPPRFFSKLAKFLIYLSIILLILTLFFGARVNDAGRWLEIPVINTRFQTSDIAKLALVVFLAKMLAVNKDKLGDLKKGFLPIILPAMAVVLLIFRENFSTAALVFGLTVVMLFIGKTPIKFLLLLFGSAFAGLALIILLSMAIPGLLPRVDTWMSRLENQYDGANNPREEMQINNAQLAIYNGGVIGKGPSKGELKHYIPEAYADFYYASFIEEFGFLGGFVLVLMYMILLFRSIKIGLKADKLFQTYVCIGLGLLMVFQALINMMVCTKLMPVTGQNMPLLSMGGTSTWFTCISLGIILSISRLQSQKEVKNNLNINEALKATS